MSNKVMRGLLLAALVGLTLAGPVSSISAAGTDGNLILSSPMLQGTEPVTVYDSDFNFISTLDPQKAEDTVSVDPIQNLFVGLTDVDPKTSQIRPAAATSWKTSDDGSVWTFTLRNDIPWIRWDPKTQKATEIRKVTAADFEYGMKRSCDPRLAAYYTAVAAAMIKGCDIVSRIDASTIKESDFDQIGVKALSDTQLEVTTQGQLGYFLSASSLWMFRAVPRETIEQYGEQWTDLGKIVTDGPYVIDQFDQSVQRIYLKNPLYPAGVTDRYGGNVERVFTLILNSNPYNLYQNDQLDTSFVPFSELARYRSQPELKKELVQRTELTTYYLGFMYDKPPFDNIHVRRAFSAILDRNLFVQEYEGGLGVPIGHFMPPGIRGSVGINEVALGKPENPGFDPEYAKKELAAGGYPDCQNLPEIRILTYAGAGRWADFVKNGAKTYLNCDVSKFVVESSEFSQLLKQIKKTEPTAQRPSMFTLGWSADYPDAHNWMHDVLSCNSDNALKRACDDLDKKIDAAGRETDPAKRDQMYRELEEGFFGQDGEFPIAPLFVNIEQFVVKPWYKGFFQTDGLFGGRHWDAYQIDQAAQLAARNVGNIQIGPTKTPSNP